MCIKAQKKFFSTVSTLITEISPAKVKLEVSHHKLENSECTSTKPLVFVLDEPPSPENVKIKKEKKTKKQGKAQTPAITAKNFGGLVSIPKIKAAELLIVAWRCRCLGF